MKEKRLAKNVAEGEGPSATKRLFASPALDGAGLKPDLEELFVAVSPQLDAHVAGRRIRPDR